MEGEEQIKQSVIDGEIFYDQQALCTHARDYLVNLFQDPQANIISQEANEFNHFALTNSEALSLGQPLVPKEILVT
ncbi:hypothetical protein Syun_029384 [Stephania yunnanensis]|uniref:Uncharacterized protein n=1 Tax=Stephania yunnanensis TaxID=152371 RepID=A0AAP0E7W1_9MAGN